MSVVSIGQTPEKGLERVNKVLSGINNGAFRAVSSAMRRAGDAAKTQAGRLAAEEYAITKSTFMENVSVKTSVSSEGGSVASMSVRYAGHVIPLIAFNTRYGRDGKVQVEVKRGGGQKELDHAFVARMGGSMGIHERVGSKSTPTERKYGPSAAHMLQNEEVAGKMAAVIEETYNKRIEHEMLRLLNGWGG